MSLFKKRSDSRSTADPVAPSARPTGTAPGGLPIWPSGIATFADGMLEVTTGDGLRVAARDILAIEGTSGRGGRLSLTVVSGLGLGKLKRSYWVDARHEAALRDLVHAVVAAS